MSRRSCRSAISVALALAALLAPEVAFALAGKVTHLSGAVVARRTDGQSRILSLNSDVNEGDLVVTADNTYVRIKFSDGGDIVLRPGTQLKIDAYTYSEESPSRDNFAMSLLKGGMRAVTGLLGKRNPASFRLTTTTATVGIRGTHFGALLCNNDCAGVPGPGGQPPANGMHLDVSDGAIVVTTRAGSLEFKVGDYGYVANRNAQPVLVPQGQGTRVNLPAQVLTSQQSSPGRSGIARAQNNECQVAR